MSDDWRFVILGAFGWALLAILVALMIAIGRKRRKRK
ncbi:hypothetical protein FHT28_000842 [Rhizobium sp. SG570]|nr:hypothetical protein [Rhizobium sp. SG570]